MIEYISPIDPHVHFRWNEYPDHDFMNFAFEDGKAVGLAGMIAQGNTNPSLTNKDSINAYLARADSYNSGIGFFVHGVLTPDEDQQREIMGLVEGPESRVVSAKIFYVRSTNSGDIEIIDPNEQKRSWMLGAEHGFNGNRTGHFEDGTLFKVPYDPKNPVSHSLHQPPEAETAKFEEQFRNAYDAGFEGNFIVFHTSSPDTIKLGKNLRRKLNPRFNLYFEATWAHLNLNWNDYEVHGNGVKMNPPLRNQVMQEELFEDALRGNIDMIGTDHAPHPFERKQGDKPASGTGDILFWPKGIEILKRAGIKELTLQNMIFNNANRIYELGLKPKKVQVEYNPLLWDKYGFNPYSRIDGTT